MRRLLLFLSAPPRLCGSILLFFCLSSSAAILIGNGLVGTTGNGLYAPLSLIPQSNPLILSNGNIAFGVNYTINLTNGGFTNTVVAGNYTLRQGPYTVPCTIPDTTNIVYLTNTFTGGLYSNYVYNAAPAVYGTKVDSNDVVAGFLLSKLLNTPGITWSVTNAGGNEQIVLTDTSGGFSGVALTNLIGVTSNALYTLAESGGFNGAALTNWIGVLSTNATNFTFTVGFNDTNFAQAMGLALTNWAGALSTNATNFAQGTVGLAATNLALAIGANDTNFAKTIGSAITNWTGVLSTNATNYAASQAAAAIAVAGILSTNATNDIVTTSNILYSFIGGGGFSGLALTNWIGVLSTNTTNFAQSLGTTETNWIGVLSTNATNFAGLLSTNATNFTGTLSTNSTNFAQSIGTTLTNWAGVLSTNATNFAQGAVGLALTNYAAAIGANDTNFAKTIGTTISNYAESGSILLSNYVAAGATLPSGATVTNLTGTNLLFAGNATNTGTLLSSNILFYTNTQVLAVDMRYNGHLTVSGGFAFTAPVGVTPTAYQGVAIWVTNSSGVPIQCSVPSAWKTNSSDLFTVTNVTKFFIQTDAADNLTNCVWQPIF